MRARCTNDEFSIIQDNAGKAGLSMSEYVRSMALYGRLTIKESTADFALINELRKIGVNINQQTRKLNTYAQLPAALPPLWDKLSTLLDRIIETV